MFSLFTVVLGECGNVLTGRIYFGFQEWCLILHWCQFMSVPFGLEIYKKNRCSRRTVNRHLSCSLDKPRALEHSAFIMNKKVMNFYHVMVIHFILVVNQQGIQNSNAVLLSIIMLRASFCSDIWYCNTLTYYLGNNLAYYLDN